MEPWDTEPMDRCLHLLRDRGQLEHSLGECRGRPREDTANQEAVLDLRLPAPGL